MKPEIKTEKAAITCLDMRIAVSVLICCLTATLLNHFGVKFPLGEMRLEIIQKMTACISCLLCCQDTTTVSKKAGINRLIITAVGGIVAICVVALDNVFANEWLMVLMVTAGVLLQAGEGAVHKRADRRRYLYPGGMHICRKCKDLLRGVPLYLHILCGVGGAACNMGI